MSAFQIDDLIKPVSALAKLAAKYTGEERTRAIIAQQHEEDAHEMYVLLHRLVRRLNEHGIDVEADITAEPAAAARAAEDYIEAAATAAPEKRDVLKRLTLRRFDPRVPRDVRGLWFELAAQLTDHEIHALMLVKPGSLSFSTQDKQAHYTTGPLHWSADEFDDNLACLSFTASKHPLLLTFSPYSSQYYLTAEGTRFLKTMTEYDEEMSDATTED
jgi:hypothetical protein